jgi:hypothetical protein
LFRVTAVSSPAFHGSATRRVLWCVGTRAGGVPSGFGSPAVPFYCLEDVIGSACPDRAAGSASATGFRVPSVVLDRLAAFRVAHPQTLVLSSGALTALLRTVPGSANSRSTRGPCSLAV